MDALNIYFVQVMALSRVYGLIFVLVYSLVIYFVNSDDPSTVFYEKNLVLQIYVEHSFTKLNGMSQAEQAGI